MADGYMHPMTATFSREYEKPLELRALQLKGVIGQKRSAFLA